MAIVAVNALRTRISVDRELNRTYTSWFRVKTNDVDESAARVVDAPGIPTVRTPYKWPPNNPKFVDSWAFADAADGDLENPTASRLDWIVKVIHKTPTGENNDRPNNSPRANPLDEPVRYDGNFLLLDKFILRDTNGDIMATTAEQPYPEYRIEDHRDALTVTVNTATIDLELRRKRIGKLNQSSFWGFSSKEAQLTNWLFNIQYYGPDNVPYVINRLEFQFDPETKFQAIRPNVGSQELVNSGSSDPEVRYGAIKDSDGNIIQTPLTSAGLSDPGQSPVENQQYDVIETANFADLPVPTTLPNPPFA